MQSSSGQHIKILHFVPAVSLLTTLSSYIIISGYLEIERRKKLKILEGQSQVKVEQIQVRQHEGVQKRM